MICLGVSLFVFILFGNLCVFCTWLSVFFFRFGKYPVIISSTTFDPILSLFSFWDLYNVNIWMLNVSPEISQTVCIFFFNLFFFLLLWLGDFLYSVFQMTYAFFFLYHLVCYSFLLVFIFSQPLNSSFPIGSFFICSGSLLKISVCIFILFCNSVDIFIINALNSLSGKLFISVLFFFPQGFSLAVSIESRSSAFSFCLAFSASMNLG